ncbi:MAG: CHAT domain-containing protein [Vicinamibacteria bacterium]|nr:CHAT domain-containing protein [Vicinamibacteria bacterium]
MVKALIWTLPLPLILLAGFETTSAREKNARTQDRDEAPAAGAIKALIDDGRYAEAEKAARLLVDRIVDRGQADSLPHAEALHLLAHGMWYGGKYGDPETKEAVSRALILRERLLGPEHLDVAMSANLFAIVLSDSGENAEARPLYERALAIREKALGPEHPEVAKVLDNLGFLEWEIGEHAAARRRFERALAINEKALGPDDPQTARSLDNLGGITRWMGDFVEARALHERALAVAEKSSGSDHPDVAVTLNNLANVLFDTGDYSAALRLFERSVAIREKALGPEHPKLAVALTNLGLILEAMGDGAAARARFERALAIREKALGPDHPYVADTLSCLGPLLLKNESDVALGRRHLERALAIRESALGREHADVAQSLSDLAAAVAIDEPRAAERLFQQSVAVFESTLGGDHPKVAATLVALARLADRTDYVTDAALLLERALSIFERAFGPVSPFVAETRAALAVNLAARGDDASAVQAALDAEEVAREHARATVRTLGERQATLYAAARASGLDLAVALLVEHPQATAERRRDVMDALVRSRALVLDEMAARQRAAVITGDPEIERLARDVSRARERLARFIVRGMDESPIDLYRKMAEDASREKRHAEEALAVRSLAFRDQQTQADAGLAEVEQALPAGAALVAFVRYDRTRSSTPPAGKSGNEGASYAAFALKAGHDPELVSLGTAATIEGAVARWRRDLLWETQAPGLAPRRSLGRYIEAAAALRRLIWDPVASLLGGTDTIFIVPDGALHLVNFAALPLDDGRYLIEAGPLLHMLSAERDLAAVSQDSTGDGLLLMGAPEFTSGRMRASAHGFRGTTATCADFHEMRFPPLPSAMLELESIEALWRRNAGAESDASALLVFRGPNADEAAFKDEAPGRRLIHLATHGFVLGKECDATEGNPLLRSGLALAGANRRGAASPDVEDGLLTAEEIAALDLSGVEWVVLSACESGLGEITEGEGVFGLRRAFQVAGARAVIMSLWPVEDASARTWMECLYRRRLEDGLGTAEAVRRASLDVLRLRRDGGQSEHPLYWAGFLAVGDWR